MFPGWPSQYEAVLMLTRLLSCGSTEAELVGLDALLAVSVQATIE